MVESPEASNASVPPELLERDLELEELDAALAAVVAGTGRLAVVDGAAGIGKTALLREIRARAHAGGAAVLSARGGELERTFPFGVVRQLFEPVVARASAKEREALFEGAAALAAPLFVTGPTTASDASDVESAFSMLHGLYWLTANLAERGPLMLAVDDLHWADVASLRWLAYLARRIEGIRVLVVGTVRRLETDADPALAELASDPATLSVYPAPLTLAAATEIVSRRLLATGPEVARASHEATGGNPLLLRELLNALVAAQPSDEPERLVGEVQRLAPGVVARRVRLEFAKLGPEATRLAEAVAVLGDDVELDHAAALAGLEHERAQEAAGRLVRAELLGREPLLRFFHPLLRAAAYDEIAPAVRDAAHGRAATVLAEAGAAIERVAAQLVEAPPAGRADAVDTLREAARRATSDGAPESAAAYLRRALAEPPPADERVGILLELARAEALVGAPDTVDHLHEAVALLEDRPRRAAARLELARAFFWISDEERAVAEIEAGIQEAEDPGLRRALEAEYFATALRAPGLQEDAHARLALLTVPDADDWGSRMLLSLKAYALAFRGEDLEPAVALAERGIAGGMTWENVTWPLWGGVYTLLWADRFDPALTFVDEVLAETRRRGAPFSFSGTSMVRSAIGFHLGRLDEAEADARASLEALPHRKVMFAPHSFGWLVHVLVDRGRLDEASALLAEAGADGAVPETFAMVPLLRARGVLRFAQGNPAAAATDALACGRVLEAVGVRNPAAAHWRSEAAIAQLAAGEADEARRLASIELDLARRWGAPRAIGRALRTLGLAEGGEAGIATLRESVLALEESPALLERARSMVELGGALRRSLKRIEARDRLRAGLDLAQRCAATALAERAREELVAAGAKPRSAAISGAESLTPSERRIAAMAADGMTNRQIAQSLFVTPRTVEMHLSNAFRKLEIGSRTQLAGALAR